MHVHINAAQNTQLTTLVALTGIDKATLFDEGLKLFLERWEYVLRQDPYSLAVETQHYETLASLGHTLEIDTERSPGNAIACFLRENIALNAIALSYVARKALGLLFEGKNIYKVDKKRHI